MIDQFDILAISEHCLFQEQLGILKSSCGNTYNCNAASANDNPPILSGRAAHGGVALLWNVAIDDYISPLDNIKSDRIDGIQCEFPGHVLLFIFGVYLPPASHNLEEYGEYFDYLWALYDPLSSNGKVILMGDFNGDLGNSLGNKDRREPNQRGLKLLNLTNYFNLCPVSPIQAGGHCASYRFFPCCDKTVSSRLMKLSDF